MLSSEDVCLVETNLCCRLSRLLKEFCKGDSAVCIVWKARALGARTSSAKNLVLRNPRLLSPPMLPGLGIISEHFVIFIVNVKFEFLGNVDVLCSIIGPMQTSAASNCIPMFNVISAKHRFVGVVIT